MTSLADLEIDLEDLKERGSSADEAVVDANALAEAVVGFIAERISEPDPLAEALDDVVRAASLAQQGYEEVRGRYGSNAPERETLIQLAGYWELRAAAARDEARVMRNMSALAAAVTAPATPPTSDLSVSSMKAATTSVAVAEVKPKSDLGTPQRDRRPEAGTGEVTRQATDDDLGSAEELKDAPFRKDSGARAIGAPTSSKGTEGNALGLNDVTRGKGQI